ncbi:hypothetical protein [Streptomyces sp. CoH17]|uniref:hypothetical protein n=1 Tax=Streptomyces sp. CoH17 TaxID=2992806 RepID=UPI0022705136|nr:hypothetical protein [Streptomyces sp. CoH17]
MREKFSTQRLIDFRQFQLSQAGKYVKGERTERRLRQRIALRVLGEQLEGRLIQDLDTSEWEKVLGQVRAAVAKRVERQTRHVRARYENGTPKDQYVGRWKWKKEPETAEQ